MLRYFAHVRKSDVLGVQNEPSRFTVPREPGTHFCRLPSSLKPQEFAPLPHGRLCKRTHEWNRGTEVHWCGVYVLCFHYCEWFTFIQNSSPRNGNLRDGLNQLEEKRSPMFATDLSASLYVGLPPKTEVRPNSWYRPVLYPVLTVTFCIQYSAGTSGWCYRILHSYNL